MKVVRSNFTKLYRTLLLLIIMSTKVRYYTIETPKLTGNKPPRNKLTNFLHYCCCCSKNSIESVDTNAKYFGVEPKHRNGPNGRSSVTDEFVFGTYTKTGPRNLSLNPGSATTSQQRFSTLNNLDKKSTTETNGSSQLTSGKKIVGSNGSTGPKMTLAPIRSSIDNESKLTQKSSAVAKIKGSSEGKKIIRPNETDWDFPNSYKNEFDRKIMESSTDSMTKGSLERLTNGKKTDPKIMSVSESTSNTKTSSAFAKMNKLACNKIVKSNETEANASCSSSKTELDFGDMGSSEDSLIKGLLEKLTAGKQMIRSSEPTSSLSPKIVMDQDIEKSSSAAKFKGSSEELRNGKKIIRPDESMKKHSASEKTNSLRRLITKNAKSKLRMSVSSGNLINSTISEESTESLNLSNVSDVSENGPGGRKHVGQTVKFSATPIVNVSAEQGSEIGNEVHGEKEIDDGSSLSEACSTPIIGTGTRGGSGSHTTDDDMERSLHTGNPGTRASLSSLGARSDSMASVYSGAGEGRWCGSVAVRGEVEFALEYDYKQLTFEVHVTQCRDLAPVDIKRNRSDPYVKVYLLPDKSKSGKRKTKVKKHTLNPVFDETLKFHMNLNGLETRTLWLTVWHSDMFGRNDFLGEVRMPLENKIFDDPIPRWYTLQERTEPFDDQIAYKGEVIVGLKFVPPDPAQQQELAGDQRSAMKARKNWSRGALHVLVKEARNLQTRAKHSGTCDPFCKSYLLPDKGRSGKQKTGVVRRCSGGSPVWGDTFVYKDVSLQELAERGLELTVWDHDRIASNEFLGGVRFNLGTGKHYGKPVDWMDATGREMSLWQSMLERPNFWVEGAVTLRPNLHNYNRSNAT